MTPSAIDLNDLQEKFRIQPDSPPAESKQVVLLDLLDLQTCRSFLRDVQSDLQASSVKVAASVFYKRLLPLIAGGLYCVSHHSCALDLAPGNITLFAQDTWQKPVFFLKRIEQQRLWLDRDAWRENVLRQLFIETVQPVISVLAGASGLQRNVLWAHTAYIVHHYYSLWSGKAVQPDLRQQSERDFQRLLNAPPALFGEQSGNPLNIPFANVPHPVEANEMIRLRKQCCLAYRLSGGNCCYTCPRLNETQRKEQLLRKLKG
ncbi:IucA/IucC family C-terminal-domain containing protein [Brevibacillus fulvus]|uniref:Ferric iron reductase protein FhuF n=1 Tax=Brevibacillus fulvus TaxID=1125967 RepID=A0A938XSR7_9BACL|nr:IucA/IucC family C-terminal-domain containing protein [Brevibacillus fulvus]MBM7589733.1 ferric iron reductase protein FhuF [Brevibacillus fulvus]